MRAFTIDEEIARRRKDEKHEAKRDAEQYARFDDILKGAIVGAPAVEE